MKRVTACAVLVCATLPGLAVAGPLRLRAEQLRAALERVRPGEVIEVDGGRLTGPLVVSVPVVLRGINNPVLDGQGRGTILTLGAPHISMSGFTVAHTGNSLLSDDAAILVTADDVSIQHVTIEDALHGIYVLRASGFQLRSNRIRGKPAINDENRGNGIHLHKASDGIIEGNDIADVRDGVYFNYADRNVIRHNHAARLRYGLHYMWSNFNRFSGNTFTRNIVAGNDVAVVEYGNSEANLFTCNAFVGNGTELREVGQESASRWDDGHRGNYWSAYDGWDLDGDGLGDRPYRLQDLFEYLEGERPVLRLLARGPAAAAVQRAEEAFPVLRQRQTADHRPLMRMPPELCELAAPAPESTLPERGPLAVVSALVLVAGAAAIEAGRRGQKRRQP